MKLFKTFLVLLIGTVIVISLAMIPVSAAGNITERSFTYNFTSPGTKYLSPQRKYNDSSAFMRCDRISTYPTYNDYYLSWAVASNDSTGSSFVNVSHGYVYQFQQGISHKIFNWTYEEGYKYISLAGSANWFYSFTASGIWQADTK